MAMMDNALTKAWVKLVALGFCTAALASVHLAQPAWRLLAGACVLLLAGAKARLILGQYLGLKSSRFWTNVFDLVLALFLVAAFALFAFAKGG